MSYIPQAMSGREIQHDIKFASDGPVCGLVDGVQSITLSGTTALTLTAGDNQMKCHVLIVDPAGSNTLKLPGYANADLNMVGRRISIFNNASDPGELITLQDANNAFICFVGYGDSVELVVASQDSSTGALEYLLLTKEFQHSVTGDESGAITILPAVTEKSFAVKFVQFLKNDTGASTLNLAEISNDSVNLITTDSSVTLDQDVAEGFYVESPAGEISAGQALSYAQGSTASSVGITIKVIYSLV